MCMPACNSVPATCWGFMGPAFFMNDSSLSKVSIGSVAMLVSDLSRAPLVVLPWLVRWMISSKWAVSPLVDRPFSCLVGWTPLTTWTEGLLERGDTEQNMVIIMMGKNDSYNKWVIPLPIIGIYPKKRVQIQRVNISRSQFILPVLQLFAVAPCVFRWGLQQCKPPTDLISSPLPAWFSGTQVTVYTVTVYCSQWLCIYMSAKKLSLWLKKEVVVLPFIDNSLSIFCLVIGHIDLWLWLIVSRC